MMLNINEIFGPTLQGEGPSCGTLAMFIRLNNCNFSCEWCDTPYTWKDGVKEPGTKQTAAAVFAELPISRLAAARGLVVISGGEPMLQQNHEEFLRLIELLLAENLHIEIETNGSIPPRLAFADLLDHEEHSRFIAFNISPKLSNSGVKTPNNYRNKLQEWAESNQYNRRFKFVVQADRIDQDVQEISSLLDQLGLSPDDVYLMPEGRTQAQIQTAGPLVAQAAIEHGYHFTSRLHINLWGSERKR